MAEVTAEAECASGETVVGGGFFSTSESTHYLESRPTKRSWKVTANAGEGVIMNSLRASARSNPFHRLPRRMFEKVLVANRGEIAVRVIRTLKEMGIGSVAVYSEADRETIPVRIADEAYLLGPPTPAESYLNIPKIIEVAKEAGVEAIHPGYGFLAENATFAMALDDADITFIGPPAAAIEAMGSKTKAREIMQDAGVPIVPGSTEPSKDAEAAKKVAEEIGYPVACKAAGGGGGKGFRVAMSEDELEEAFEGAAREGEKFFSDDRVYLERYLEDPRHVEVQVLADSHGNVIHLGERDCSIQRRHQKLIEEAPARSSTTRCASASARSRRTRPRPSTTAAPERSRACRSATSTSSSR